MSPKLTITATCISIHVPQNCKLFDYFKTKKKHNVGGTEKEVLFAVAIFAARY